MKIKKKHIHYFLIAGQAALWSSFVWLLFENRTRSASLVEGVSAPSLLEVISLVAPFIILINLNWYLIAPRYLKIGTYLKYCVYMVLGVVFCASLLSSNLWWHGIDSNQLMLSTQYSEPVLIPGFLVNLYMMFLAALISLPFYLSFDWFQQENLLGRLQTEKLEAELSTLKSQINPHFLFNTLNNLHALTLSSPESASKALLRFSELMRYVTYEGMKSRVMIQDELDYIENYFQIQKIRSDGRVDIDFEHEVDDLTTELAPLLFVNLLENPFKHGSDSMTEPGFIKCFLKLKKRELTFQIENDYQESDSATRGTGLSNLSRRLELLYPDSHDLSISSHSGVFFVSLTIQDIDEISHS